MTLADGSFHFQRINASDIIPNECTQITNLVLCISVLDGCLMFGNLIHLPKDTLNARGKSKYANFKMYHFRYLLIYNRKKDKH